MTDPTNPEPSNPARDAMRQALASCHSVDLHTMAFVMFAAGRAFERSRQASLERTFVCNGATHTLRDLLTHVTVEALQRARFDDYLTAAWPVIVDVLNGERSRQAEGARSDGRDAGGFSRTPCGKTCDHGSPCELPADHLPATRHETEHGCTFYSDECNPVARCNLCGSMIEGDKAIAEHVCIPPAGEEGTR